MRLSLRTAVIPAISVLGTLFASLLLYACSAGVTTGASSADPAFSPDGGKVAFDRVPAGQTGNSDIWVMNADGTNPTNLTNGLAHDSQPAWSPDGTRIAFASSSVAETKGVVTAPAVAGIWVMNADGSARRNLVNASAIAPVYSPVDSPAWSPDGKKIAFVLHSGENKATNIWVVDADGSNPISLTNGPANDSSPAWSPDGKKIVFSSDRGGGPNAASNIWAMDVDGNDPVNLTKNEGWDAEPAWSPDGSRIAFAHAPADHSRNPDIWIMNSDGSSLTALTNHPGVEGYYTPAWSPDGRKIAFTRNLNYNNQVYIMNTGSTNVTKLSQP